MAGAAPEPDDSFARIPQTCYEVEDPVEGVTVATASLSEPAIPDLPDEIVAATAEPAATEPATSAREGGAVSEVLAPEAADDEIVPAVAQLAEADPSALAQRAELTLQLAEVEEYDPWLPFNEPVFSFNRQFDRVLVKPLATVWDTVVPDPVQRSLGRAFDNLGMPRRFLNSLFQAKLVGAGRELARFLLNTTFGIAGFFDVAKEMGIEKSDEDTGQTLGVYGVGPGPYLILPFLPPLTVRDGIGWAADLAMDPLNYILPFPALAGTTGGKTINDRSLNLELYQNVEETVLDLYTAVRNGYLQRRAKAIRE